MCEWRYRRILVTKSMKSPISRNRRDLELLRECSDIVLNGIKVEALEAVPLYFKVIELVLFQSSQVYLKPRVPWRAWSQASRGDGFYVRQGGK